MALTLTVLIGIVAGWAMAHRSWQPLFVLAAYSFGCTLLMGLLAGRRQVAVAIAASVSVSAAYVAIEFARTAPVSASRVVVEALPAWMALFMLSALCAAVAIPLSMVRLRAA